jgi:hypothetical protein
MISRLFSGQDSILSNVFFVPFLGYSSLTETAPPKDERRRFLPQNMS